MIRSLIALVLTASVSMPAFAQSTGDQLWGALTSLKEKIVQYDEGTGKALAYYGGKTTKYSLIAIGAAYAAKQGAVKAVENAPVASTRLLSRNFFSYNTAGRVSNVLHADRVATTILDTVGGPVLATGLGLLGASAVVFFAEHLWYNTFGHPDQTAANREFAQFLALPVESQFAIANSNPELAARVIELDAAVAVK
jgi:hypothetical protein